MEEGDSKSVQVTLTVKLAYPNLLGYLATAMEHRRAHKTEVKENWHMYIEDMGMKPHWSEMPRIGGYLRLQSGLRTDLSICPIVAEDYLFVLAQV